MAEVTVSSLPPAPSADSPEAKQARKQSNLAYTFVSLDRDRREAMAVFYDFCRVVDDIADDPGKPDGDKIAALAAWREDIEACYRPGAPLSLATELAPVIRRFDVRRQDLLAIIDGVSMDIGERRYETFDDLRQYCFGVASAVGLVSVRIFGCVHPQIDAYAETLGYALQFTNILRDVVEDYAEMGRVYLPQEELRAFGVREEDLANPADSERCQRLFRLCHYRCKHFFNKARRLLPASERRNLKAALIMGAFYEDILDRIAGNGFRLTRERIRLPKQRKVQLAVQTLRGLRRPLPTRREPGRAVVWGGGVAGVTAAIELGEQGFTPTLLESKAYLGGRSHSLTDAPSGLRLDNGQHIVMGCYHAFLSLLERLGVDHKFTRQDRLCVPYVSPGGEWSELAAKEGPPPFHLLGGLLNFEALSTNDRFAIMAFGAKMRLGGEPADHQTALNWLREHGQTAGAIRALWEPFCVAALNERLETACARLLHETLRRSLFGSKKDSAIFLANVGLTEVFEPETEHYLRAIGGEVRRKTQIKAVEAIDDVVAGVRSSKGELIEGELHVSALPWNALRALLPSGCTVKNRVSSIPSAAIVSIHLLVDQPLFKHASQFVGLLDSPIHWVFDRTHTLTDEHAGQFLYAVIISAADEWLPLKSEAIVERLRRELTRFFEPAKSMTINRSLVYKSRDATFAARPTTASYRPKPTDSPWDNVWLAGDWIQTGLPATIESASFSAYKAVEAIDAGAHPPLEKAI